MEKKLLFFWCVNISCMISNKEALLTERGIELGALAYQRKDKEKAKEIFLKTLTLSHNKYPDIAAFSAGYLAMIALTEEPISDFQTALNFIEQGWNNHPGTPNGKRILYLAQSKYYNLIGNNDLSKHFMQRSLFHSNDSINTVIYNTERGLHNKERGSVSQACKYFYKAIQEPIPTDFFQRWSELAWYNFYDLRTTETNI